MILLTLSKVKEVLIWFYKLGEIFFKYAPVYTFGILVLTLTSQISIFLASILPLKVLFLLESSKVPSFFPIFLQTISLEYLIFILSATAILFFVSHLLSERFVDFFVKNASDKIIKSTGKIVLFENQDTIAQNYYSKYTRSFAGLIFSIVVVFLLSFYYLYIVYATLCYTVIYLIIITTLYNYSDIFKNYFIDNFGKISKLFSNIGPLIIFFVIIFDHLYSYSHPSIIVAVVGLLLIRQAINKISAFIKDMFFLYRNRVMINSLFSQTHIRSIEPQKKDSDFWSIMQNRRRNIWISEIISDITGEKISIEKSVFIQTSMTNILSFSISLKSENFYIRVFNQNMSSKALHEMSILSSFQKNTSVGLKFLGVSNIGKYRCHLFRQNKITFITHKELKNATLEIKSKLLAIKPDKILLESYLKTHPSLRDRLDKNILKFLRVVRSSKNTKDIQFFIDNFEKLKSIISNLPLKIVNPEVNIRNIVVEKDSSVKLLSWVNWSFEPIGAGWDIKEFELLKKSFYDLKNDDSSLKHIDIKQLYISALLFDIELWVRRQRFDIAETYLSKLRKVCIDDDLFSLKQQ